MTDWPGTYERIVQAVGDKAAIKLVSHYGGISVYIPKSASASGALVQLLGRMHTDALIAEFGHGALMVPMGVEENYARKRRQIAARLRQHQSHSTIARDLQVHVRTVERIAERLRLPARDPRQASLFD